MNRLIFSFLLSCFFMIVSLTSGMAKSNEPTITDDFMGTHSLYFNKQCVDMMSDISNKEIYTAKKVHVSLESLTEVIIPTNNILSQIKVEPSSGSYLGACENEDYYIKISGAAFGDGMDISSVTICGVEVCQILMQSSNFVVVFPNSGNPGTGDIVITSESVGKTTIENAFTYKVPVLIEKAPKIIISNVDVQ